MPHGRPTRSSLARHMRLGLMSPWLLTGACLAAQASAPDAATSDADASSTASSVATAAGSAAVPTETVLLREGSRLVNAVGWLEYRREPNEWVFVLEMPQETVTPSATSPESPASTPGSSPDDAPPAEDGEVDRADPAPDAEPEDPSASTTHVKLVLLPCTTLMQMQRVAAVSLENPPRFRVTGDVFVHDARNYLLPTYAPRLVPDDESRDAPVDETPGAAADDEAELDTLRPEEGGESIESIVHELETAAGPAAESPGRQSPEGEEEALFDPRLLSEGTELTNRRGQLTRDSGGAWVFVLESDATGGEDPPLTVLPCRLLEHMRSRVRRGGGSTPLLLSGRVYVYRGRNYVLPSSYRLPVTRSEVNPLPAVAEE